MTQKFMPSLLLVPTLLLLMAGCGGTEPTPTSPATPDTEATSELTAIPSPTVMAVLIVATPTTEIPTPTPTEVSKQEPTIPTPIPTATPIPPTPPKPTSTSTPIPPTPEPTIRRDELDGVYPCSGDGTRNFTSTVFPTNLITHIEPMGKMSSSHVTPTDHLYVYRNIWEGEDTEYVLAPADGWITSISNNEERTARWDSSITVPDQRIVFMHTCTFFTIFIHVGELAPGVATHTGEIPQGTKWFSTRSAPVLVKAGEPIAKMGLTGFDWSVHDTDTILTGFVIPNHYEGENWKIHTVDPFQFFDDPLKSDLLSKAVRKVEPQAGKIDYDVEGTIAGNWFKDGTVGYRSLEGSGGSYWTNHITIAYDWIDPTKIRVSIGFDTGINDDQDCNVCFGNYAVRGNKPDPNTIRPETGLVKYELMSRTGVNHVEVGTTSLGTFLVQHLGDHTIRVQVIPGKAPAEVGGFSDASIIYRR